MKTTGKICLILFAFAILAFSFYWFVGRHALARVAASREARDELTSPPAESPSAQSPKVETGISEEDRDASIAALKKQILDVHPQLRAAERIVADRDNRLLQLALFLASEFPDAHPQLIPDDLQQLLSGLAPWDVVRVSAALKERAALLDRLVEIGQLPDFSTVALDDHQSASLASVAELSSMLAARARCQFETEDLEGALKTIRSTNALIECLESSGAASTEDAAAFSSAHLAHAVAICMAGDVPVTRETLMRVRTALSRPDRTLGSVIKDLIRNDWTTLFISCMDQDKRKPEEDGSKDAIEVSNLCAVRLQQISESTPEALRDGSALPDPQLGGMSSYALSSLTWLDEDIARVRAKWLERKQRAALWDAAVCIALGETPPTDPVTGKPFEVDPVDRVLTLPEDPDFPDLIAGSYQRAKQRIPLLK
ncbi:MAG: hypothetical protein JWO82_1923 [Akkermansiaceae bacterium]|nr:hypothetical protein [Akkermansiaceae bacterium]